ncbi:hypothetical protein KCH_43190 [Kitasatospora cheerisanensis KCTC 2395]|uniref:Uncharacterized protein n=1 Tax=Kitasatospora cheerisanensis KCTC 2395 TaxID=1348663 RepID=A0A066Z0L4_9ACTN|nr:hypothetical protein KCH_43190 [Kitasatospora cheerisanensis KCTC 2395]
MGLDPVGIDQYVAAAHVLFLHPGAVGGRLLEGVPGRVVRTPVRMLGRREVRLSREG